MAVGELVARHLPSPRSHARGSVYGFWHSVPEFFLDALRHFGGPSSPLRSVPSGDTGFSRVGGIRSFGGRSYEPRTAAAQPNTAIWFGLDQSNKPETTILYLGWGQHPFDPSIWGFRGWLVGLGRDPPPPRGMGVWCILARLKARAESFSRFLAGFGWIFGWL